VDEGKEKERQQEKKRTLKKKQTLPFSFLREMKRIGKSAKEVTGRVIQLEEFAIREVK